MKWLSSSAFFPGQWTVKYLYDVLMSTALYKSSVQNGYGLQLHFLVTGQWTAQAPLVDTRHNQSLLNLCDIVCFSTPWLWCYWSLLSWSTTICGKKIWCSSNHCWSLAEGMKLGIWNPLGLFGCSVDYVFMLILNGFYQVDSYRSKLRSWKKLRSNMP